MALPAFDQPGTPVAARVGNGTNHTIFATDDRHRPDGEIGGYLIPGVRHFTLVAEKIPVEPETPIHLTVIKGRVRITPGQQRPCGIQVTKRRGADRRSP